MLSEAQKISNRLKVNDFVGTRSWLEGMKRRNGICYRKGTKVSQKTPEDSAEKIKEFNEKIIQLLEIYGYHPDSIVNIDETGLFFDTFSPKTLELKVR